MGPLAERSKVSQIWYWPADGLGHGLEWESYSRAVVGLVVIRDKSQGILGIVLYHWFVDPHHLVSVYRALEVAKLISALLYVGLVPDTAGCGFCGFLKFVPVQWHVRLDPCVAA